MNADVLVRHRQPTLRFPRLPSWEPGVAAQGYWNATRAGNGDGIGDDFAAVDYAGTQLFAARVWPIGPPHTFGGSFGGGGFGESGQQPNPLCGFGVGPWGVGAFGIGGGYFDWAFPFFLRDGTYRSGIVFADSLGNRQAGPGTEIAVRVEALPRPPTGLRLEGYDEGTRVLSLAWNHSPEFA